MSNRRNAVIRVRVTREQKQAFRRTAKAAAVSLSEWLRLLAERSSRRRAPPTQRDKPARQAAA